jgi:hypothetical protein
MTTQVSDRVSAFLTKMGVGAGRLIFALDATMSREEMWDAACEIQGEMFAEANRIGGLEVQLVYYRGLDECKASHWTQNARELADLMTRVQCRAGTRKLAGCSRTSTRNTKHKRSTRSFSLATPARKSHTNSTMRRQAYRRCFVFGRAMTLTSKSCFVSARITAGASCEFSSASARQLAELLLCVAAFAAGGRKALSKLNSESARKLLGQLKQ